MNNDARMKTTLVRDLLTLGVVTCSPDTPIKDIAREIIEKDLEAIIVLDQNGHALGVVSRKELVKAYHISYKDNLTAESVMREGVPEIPPDIPASAAASMMVDQGIRALFLSHHAGGIIYPAAVITFKNLLRHMAMDEVEDIRDLGINAERKTPIDSFIQKRDAARQRISNSQENKKES
jgi:signal-transduction protein with cAMP-binding, CBS, and nucleotidyltransferase domain